jgi:hypothetical protein
MNFMLELLKRPEFQPTHEISKNHGITKTTLYICAVVPGMCTRDELGDVENTS